MHLTLWCGVDFLGCDENSLFSFGICFVKGRFKASSVECSGLKEELLVKMNKSMENWDECSMCVAHVACFSTKEEVGPRYIGLFSSVAEIRR